MDCLVPAFPPLPLTTSLRIRDSRPTLPGLLLPLTTCSDPDSEAVGAVKCFCLPAARYLPNLPVLFRKPSNFHIHSLACLVWHYFYCQLVVYVSCSLLIPWIPSCSQITFGAAELRAANLPLFLCIYYIVLRISGQESYRLFHTCLSAHQPHRKGHFPTVMR